MAGLNRMTSTVNRWMGDFGRTGDLDQEGGGGEGGDSESEGELRDEEEEDENENESRRPSLASPRAGPSAAGAVRLPTGPVPFHPRADATPPPR